MKKWFCWLLILGMVLTIASASAEMTPSRTLEVNSFHFNTATGAYATRKMGGGKFQLMSPDGEVLVSPQAGYVSMYQHSGSPYFKVEKESADGIHDEGLLDSTGRVIVPAEYADLQIVSDRWQAGIRLVPSSADVKDYTFTNYSTNEKTYYQIDTVDFYLDGQKVGTMNRNQYGGGYMQAFGAYIAVPNREGRTVFYDSALNASPYEASYASEYDTVYENKKTTVYHQGTGQVAFAATCTLNPEDLEKDIWYDHGAVYDVQGNVLFRTVNAYDSVREYRGDYAGVYMSGKYGLIDREGREILPPEYEDVGNYEEKYLEFGYISAVKDGKFGFLDAQGNVTCDFVYAKDIVRNRCTFAEIKNLDGTIIVLAAGAGELPDHYKEVKFLNGGARAFVGRDQEDRFTVVDLEGNTLLPYTDAYRDVYVNRDATVIVGEKSGREYDIYRLADPDAVSGQDAPSGEIPIPSFDEVFVPAEPLPEVTAMPIPAAEAEGWTCENGHGGNTGNFCAECGLPKPEPTPEPTQEETWTCPNGHAGNTGNFCPECGAPRPVEEEGPWTCPNGHGGNTGNFCAECGAPRPGSGQ